MNFARYILIIFTVFISTQLSAQNYSFKNHQFLKEKIELSPEEKSLDGLVIFQDRKIEVFVDGEDVRQFYLFHQQMLVNSDQAIENNNKIYIGVSKSSKIVKNKNRVILPSGKIIELNDKDIHEEVDEETGYKYQYYAVRGLEKGAIIEKLYIKEEVPSFAGRSLYFQNSYPTKASKFQLITPKHLIFKHVSYNGLSKPEAIEGEDKEMNILEITEENLPALSSKEKMSNRAAHSQKFRYKLFENTMTGGRNFYNYNQFAKNLHSKYDVELDKKNKKEFIDYFKYITISNNETTNILNIESHIKRDITFNEEFSENSSFIDIINNHEGNLIDMIIMYKLAFDYFGIESEVVLTSNRFDAPFDPEFETSNNIREVLIYLPNTKQFLDIKNVSLRSPLINTGFANTNGIVIKEVEFGGSTMATSEAIFIDLPDGKISSDTMDIIVDFTKDINDPLVKSKITFGGYANAGLQPIKDYMNEQQYKETLKEIAKSYSVDTEMESVIAFNDGIEFLGKKNFGLDLTFYSKDLIQKAGDKYLYSIGKLIGRQGELYQEGERTLPVEMTNQRYYTRNIKVILPEGYKISNPEIVEFDENLKEGDTTTAIFTSSYKIDGNEMTISNREFYSKVDFSLEEYEDFCKVYNAAADFNKLVLVIEKK